MYQDYNSAERAVVGIVRLHRMDEYGYNRLNPKCAYFTLGEFGLGETTAEADESEMVYKNAAMNCLRHMLGWIDR